MSRSDVNMQFGLLVKQASSNLSRCIGLAPHNMYYDRSLRTYVREPSFKPVFDKLNAGRYLAQLRSIADGILDQEDCWLAKLPAYGFSPNPARGIEPMTFRSVVEAIRRSGAIEVKYQSLSSPEPRWRRIAPHAIGFDGFRWHGRARCLTDEVFKDFLLSRILEIRGSLESEVRSRGDLDWNIEITLEIGPHPSRSDTQAQVIALGYGMKGGKAEIKVCRALLYYSLRRLGLDTDPSARKPQDQQIVLLNREVIYEDYG